jgi:large subunit ribosomal protein L32e
MNETTQEEKIKKDNTKKVAKNLKSTEDTKKVQKKETVKETKAKEVETPKKKFIEKVKKAELKKSDEAWETQQKIKIKKKHPTFRGRFGKKNLRRKSIAKWDKWRKPHGIDLDKGINHGYRPKIGYGNPATIKGVHASGYREVMVFNTKDLEKIDSKTQAARIGATIGKKKRNEIITKANDKKIRILN